MIAPYRNVSRFLDPRDRQSAASVPDNWKEKLTMKTAISFFALLILVTTAGTASAQIMDFGTVHIFVSVWTDTILPLGEPVQAGTVRIETPSSHKASTDDPYLYVNPLISSMDLGTVEHGVFAGRIPFSVDGSCRNVSFFGGATNLYKGGDPGNATVPVVLEAGVMVEPTNGGPVGGDDLLEYAAPYEVEGLPGCLTEPGEFESNQAGYFLQIVWLTVTWDQNVPDNPSGEYSGIVQLYGQLAEPSAIECETWSRVKSLYR